MRLPRKHKEVRTSETQQTAPPHDSPDSRLQIQTLRPESGEPQEEGAELFGAPESAGLYPFSLDKPMEDMPRPLPVFIR